MAVKNNINPEENGDLSIINRSAKEERTYNIFDSEKDRKIWELEIENLKKKREAAKKAKSNAPEEEIETAEEKDTEMREIIVRELINYLILSYEVTKKFPVCLGKEGYYYELLVGYLSDLDKKEREKENEKGKENAKKLNQLAFNENLNQKRKEKESEAETKIDSLMKKRDEKAVQAENPEHEADEKLDKMIEKGAASKERKAKVRVQLKKVNRERDNGRTV